MLNKSLWFLGLLLPALLVKTAPVVPSGASVWKESTYKDFVDGTFSDAGANMYVSRKGRVQTINRWDLNSDGYLDLVFANSHPHAEKLDATLYWGNSRNFDLARNTAIPTNGAHFLIAADLNRDRFPDLLVPNYHNGTQDRMDSFLYLNSFASGKALNRNSVFFPGGDRTALPSQAALQAAAGDLNRDGWPDVVLVYSGGFWEYRANSFEPYQSSSRIYWGAAGGFSRERFSEIPVVGASAVAINDLNNDGWPDLAMARHESKDSRDVDSEVYWGGPQGFSAQRRTLLPTHGANNVKSADLNRDGFADLIFANGDGEASFIYYGGSQGFDPQRRAALETWEARDVAVADVDQDGFPDVLFSCHRRHGNPVVQSFLYLGSKEGFSVKKRIAFDSIGAWGVALGDLNADGRPEVVISNFQDHSSYDVPSYIYWNSAQGFHPLNRTALFTHGAAGCAIADFDQDGHADLIFANTTARSRGNHHPVSVYWGNAQGQYTPQNRQFLPGEDAYEVSVADLNDDGFADLIVANTGEVGRTLTDSFIYWGSAKGLSATNVSGLMGFYTTGTSVADLDRDGYLDVVLASSRSWGDQDHGSLIYWGSAQGFSTFERTSLPTDGSAAPLIADLNQDGYLDIAFGAGRGSRGPAIYWGDGIRGYGPQRRSFLSGIATVEPLRAADLNRDGVLDLLIPAGSEIQIYSGSPDGRFSTEGRRVLKTEGANALGLADFNRDGWLDLAAPIYSTGLSRSALSPVFWGSAAGFSEKNVTRLPTNGGTGTLAADFNRDGFLDLLLVCHRTEGNPDQIGAFGDHTAESFIYWGSRDGFSPTRRLAIPTEGPHYDFGVDPGNIYDRSYRFVYESSVFEAGSRGPVQIEWKSITPARSQLRFQLRTAEKPEDLKSSKWQGPKGPATFFESSGVRVRGLRGRWVQYRAEFLSQDGVNYPTLDEVSIRFD